MNNWTQLFTRAGFSEASFVTAAGEGDCQTLRRLLKVLPNGSTCKDDALCMAALRGHVDVVKILLQAGANAHTLDDEPLRFATQRGHTAVVEVLRAWNEREHTDRRSPGSAPAP